MSGLHPARPPSGRRNRSTVLQRREHRGTGDVDPRNQLRLSRRASARPSCKRRLNSANASSGPMCPCIPQSPNTSVSTIVHHRPIRTRTYSKTGPSSCGALQYSPPSSRGPAPSPQRWPRQPAEPALATAEQSSDHQLRHLVRMKAPRYGEQPDGWKLYTLNRGPSPRVRGSDPVIPDLLARLERSLQRGCEAVSDQGSPVTTPTPGTPCNAVSVRRSGP